MGHFTTELVSRFCREWSRLRLDSECERLFASKEGACVAAISFSRWHCGRTKSEKESVRIRKGFPEKEKIVPKLCNLTVVPSALFF